MKNHKINWKKISLLITGGTGTFGQNFVRFLLKKHSPRVIRIFSRDEYKQLQMQQSLPKNAEVRFLIGDVRDKDRLYRALENIDIVVHAAALKQVPSCEYNPFETVKTNIIGTQNIIEGCIDKKVKRVLLISSDKAVQPINLYGATKLCAEKLFVQANAYRGKSITILSVVRYGNVLASRGSVIPLFKKQLKKGTITVTDNNMTRFWISSQQAVNFVIYFLEKMQGGEIFVPKSPSLKIIDLAKTMAPKAKIKFIGKRPGEKIHETLITKEEASHAREYKNYYLIEPQSPFILKKNWGGKKLLLGFSYKSNLNKDWFLIKDLRRLIKL